eukprot:COSAG01_NODE_41466_length_451_cov_0.869318_1_plen_52_part_00
MKTDRQFIHYAPLQRRWAKFMSLGMMVTRLAWMAIRGWHCTDAIRAAELIV